MRKNVLLTLVLALVLALSGCASLVPSEYSQVALHVRPQTRPEEAGDEPRIVTTQAELRQAIDDLIQSWTTHGVIRVYSYPGNVEEELPVVAYQATREDPYGAYVVDYITHSCSLIVSYYEITLDITYRSDAVRPEEMISVSNMAAAEQAIRTALSRYDKRLVLDMAYYAPLDVEALVEAYCAADTARLMAEPQVTAELYPESGLSRILDLRFAWPHDAATLLEMEQAVADSLNAASVYVRYRDNEQEKAELLFTYLMERFTYERATSPTPIYAFLCEGLADSQSAAVSWQLLCDEAGLECYTVSGLRGGGEYWWNILCLNGGYRHVDICRDLLESGVLQTYTDSAMVDYYWVLAQYPACPDPEIEEAPQEPAAPEDQPEEETEEETTPEEEEQPQEESSETETEEELKNNA